MPSILTDLPPAPSTGPELRALPDQPALDSPEAQQAFAADLQSPEYIQALLMALSGATSPPGGAKASSGVLQMAKEWLNSIPDDALGRMETASLDHVPGYADDVQQMLAHWSAPPPQAAPTARSAIDQAAAEAPISGVLKALKFSLGHDLPKTAAMAAR
jgi:hypothetical protein